MRQKQRWIEAGGAYQFLFMGVVSRVIKGDYHIECPKCRKDMLRFYFHIFDKTQDTGTMWVWCPFCKTTSHLPRVQPEAKIFKDPFADLSLEEFQKLECNETETTR